MCTLNKSNDVPKLSHDQKFPNGSRNLEKKIKRQVVLEDGRVIVEDAPEVTVDTVEDRQSHEDEGEEDR